MHRKFRSRIGKLLVLQSGSIVPPVEARVNDECRQMFYGFVRVKVRAAEGESVAARERRRAQRSQERIEIRTAENFRVAA
jgi:hypothetical protein